MTTIDQMLEESSILLQHDVIHGTKTGVFIGNREIIKAALPIIEKINLDEDGDPKFKYAITFINYLNSLIKEE